MKKLQSIWGYNSFSFRPVTTITIANCGEIAKGEDLGVYVDDGTPDKYPHHPEDLDLDW